MADNWGLKKLFHFDSEHWNIKNDTSDKIIIRSASGQEIEVGPGSILNSSQNSHSIILPNNCTINYSDKSIIKEPDFSDNFNVVIAHLMNRLQDGNVIDGIDFLDYHYKWTKDRKRFLSFIKHYIISMSWIQVDKRNKFDIYMNAISDWVDEKKKERKRTVYIILLIIPLIVYTIGLVWLPEYREIFIGALIAGLIAPLRETYELITD